MPVAACDTNAANESPEPSAASAGVTQDWAGSVSADAGGVSAPPPDAKRNWMWLAPSPKTCMRLPFESYDAAGVTPASRVAGADHAPVAPLRRLTRTLPFSTHVTIPSPVTGFTASVGVCAAIVPAEFRSVRASHAVGAVVPGGQLWTVRPVKVLL